MNALLDYSSLTDRRLVELHLDGDREAFRQIVERYQAMVCALGLSACGDVGRSEDLAQEVFVVAWKQLPGLHEPDKLRGWLAGIARNLIHNSFRREQRIPTARAEPLSGETPAHEAGPREQAIDADEAALMWSTLEGIPENYREPMVLFYREHCSVPAVAAALEISEDNVRQRLVRGRAMLTERMAKLVEETLERSAPTPAFASMVILALPAVVAETTLGAGGAAAKTAVITSGVAVAAAKGGLAVKALAVAGILPVVFSGVVDFIKFRTRYDALSSVAGRRRIVATYLAPNLIAAGLTLAFLAQHVLNRPDNPLARASLTLWMLCSVAVVGLPIVALVSVRRWRKRTEEAVQMENDAPDTGPASDAKAFEYRSQRSVLGLPLLHVHVGGQTPVMRRAARGWIAVSDGVALGGLFACGGRLAVAPVSFGLGSVGFMGVGIFSLGLGAVGGLACGAFSFGIISFGWKAAQAMTFAASGKFAQGFYATATHANDAVAALFFHNHLFFRVAAVTTELAGATLWFAWVVPLVLMSRHLWRTRAVR